MARLAAIDDKIAQGSPPSAYTHKRRQAVKHSIPRSLHLTGRAVGGVKSLRRLAVATALVSATLLFGLQAAQAETHIFKDALRPGGVERSAAQKDADSRACGAGADGTFTNVPAFEKCMRAHGWALAGVKADASDADGLTWDDLRPKGRARSDGELQADARRCNPSDGAVTASVKRCMLRLGWRYAFAVSRPKPAEDPGTYISPETGNVCRTTGFIAVCTPPSGTVYYYNEDGRPCRRTGLVSICT